MIEYIKLRMMVSKLNSLSQNTPWLNYINNLKNQSQQLSKTQAGFQVAALNIITYIGIERNVISYDFVNKLWEITVKKIISKKEDKRINIFTFYRI